MKPDKLTWIAGCAGEEAATQAWADSPTLDRLVNETAARFAARNASAPAPLPVLVISGDSDAACPPAAMEAAVVAPLRRAGGVSLRWTRKRLGDHCLCRHRGEAVREAVGWAVRCAGLEGVECGERLGSPWIRCQAAFDFFPLALLVTHAAGWLAGAFAVSPRGRALAAAQEEEERARGLAETRRRRDENPPK
jgi:hypothetical protein